MIPKSSFYVPHPPPIKKPPGGVVFLLVEMGSRKRSLQATEQEGTCEDKRAACPERSEDVQHLSISANRVAAS